MEKRVFENKTLDKINTEQLAHNENSVDVYKETQDTPSDFTEKGVDFCADKSIMAETEFPTFQETERFAKEISIEGLETKLRKEGRA